MRQLAFVPLLVMLASLVSCFGGSSDGLSELTRAVDSLRQQVERMRSDLSALTEAEDDDYRDAFTLQLLHASDMDGSAGALQNVENFSAILAGFRAQYPDNTLLLSSGDNWIPGPRYFAAADPSHQDLLGMPGNGRGDIALLNAMGFQASALGNHELDRGTAEFASVISSETGDAGTYTGAMFPYLSANLDFSMDESLRGLVVPEGQEASLVAAGLARSAVVTVGGHRVGIVGATTPSLSSITPTGGIEVLPTNKSVEGLAAILQDSIDALTAQGIDKVVLLAHMQRIDVEQTLATRLSDVDIIVAGGSNTLLADSTDRLRPEDNAAGAYPIAYESATGEPVLLVNTDADYRYLGRLVVDFDADGRIIPTSIDPHVSGVYATDRQGGQLFAGRPIPEVSRIAASLRRVMQERDGNILGRTAVYLAGRRGDVRTQETNLGNLTADAYLWLARLFDPETQVSIKNGGGIRDHIGRVTQPPGTVSPNEVQFLPPAANPVTGKMSGEVSQLDIEGALRFNNGLVIVPITAETLVKVMEHSIAFDGVGEAWVGNFPQVSGMRFSFDPDAPSGHRIRSMAVVEEGGEVIDRVVVAGRLSGDPEREIKVVTLDFLADRGSGFPFPVPLEGRVDLTGEAGQADPSGTERPDNGRIDSSHDIDPGRAGFAPSGTEQDALAEYLANFHFVEPYDTPETGPLEDQRIQNLGVPGKTDTVFMPVNGN